MAKKIITMEFEDEELVHDFFAWMCDGGGEQLCDDPEGEYYTSFDYFCGADKFLGNDKVSVYRTKKE